MTHHYPWLLQYRFDWRHGCAILSRSRARTGPAGLRVFRPPSSISTRKQAPRVGTITATKRSRLSSPRMLAVFTEVIGTAKKHGAGLCIIDTAPHSETTALAGV